MALKSNIRLFLQNRLAMQAVFPLDEAQSHYLFHVMKLKNGDEFLVFNAEDGEFLAKIIDVNKKSLTVCLGKQTRSPMASPDIWLLFAPLKKDQTDFVIQKATELGCAKIIPVITKFTITDKTRIERFKAQAIEAAEQSRRLDVPLIEEAVPLAKVIANWDKQRPLYFMDETGGTSSVFEAFLSAKQKNISNAAILVGPEGGFSAEEIALLRGLEFAHSVSLGKRILRAETAVAAALSCWQAIAGDWNTSDD